MPLPLNDAISLDHAAREVTCRLSPSGHCFHRSFSASSASSAWIDGDSTTSVSHLRVRASGSSVLMIRPVLQQRLAYFAKAVAKDPFGPANWPDSGLDEELTSNVIWPAMAECRHS